MLTVPEDIYELLVRASGESMRPIATEALYRIKEGLEVPVELGGEKRITITILDSVYEMLEKDRGTNSRSAWIQYLILVGGKEEIVGPKRGLAEIQDNRSKRAQLYKEVGTIPDENNEKTKGTQPIEDYSEIIEEINKVNGEGYNVEPSDTQRIKEMCKEKGVQYNNYKKTLDKKVNGEWVVVARI
ncbi:MAG: hypothetical protein UT94_C0024G0020 [Candidatus Uhrbacteria bacterium GW2011_GWF2_40_263]|nr:MAG: hypothetical protein UT94_C0024G0020 [Candidatus Uhrbacteria bacterium GW2011_GWF2_40_263]